MEARHSPHPPPPAARPRWAIPTVLAVLAIGGVAWGLLADTSGWGSWLMAIWRDHRAELLALVDDQPLAAALTILLAHAVLAALALPGASLLMLVAGAGYGPWLGTLLCLSGCTAGASANMLAVRHWLRDRVRRGLGERLAGIDARIAADGAAYLFSLRLLPVVPFALTNAAAGVSRMNVWTFTWVSFVGMLAGTWVYVNLGTELGRIDTLGELYSPRVLLSFVALAALPWLAKLALAVWQGRVEARA